MTDERQLLARARGLEPEALAEIHDQFYRPIFRYVAFRVSDTNLAEDLTGEVFTRLLTALDKGSGPDQTLAGWLYGVAANVVTDHNRRRYRAEHVPLDETLAAGGADPAEGAEKALAMANLREAMEDLTEDQQEVIALRFGYGLSIRDVAWAMGKSEGAIKQLQARAVAQLSKRMAPGVVD